MVLFFFDVGLALVDDVAFLHIAPPCCTKFIFAQMSTCYICFGAEKSEEHFGAIQMYFWKIQK